MNAIGSKYGVRDRGKSGRTSTSCGKPPCRPSSWKNLFIDHSNDLKLLNNSAFITDLSHAIGEGIAKALSLSKKVLYKVIAGSFKDRQNAENRKNYPSSKGISSVIVEVKIEKPGTAFRPEPSTPRRRRKPA